jgi:hypothetical protein
LQHILRSYFALTDAYSCPISHPERAFLLKVSFIRYGVYLVDVPEYTVIIPSYGQPYTKNNVIYIPLDFLESCFTRSGINKETVFKHIFEHEKLHITNGDTEYSEPIITTVRGFKKYARYLRRVEKAALPPLRFDNDEEYQCLNEICIVDLEARIEDYRKRFCKHGKLRLVEMHLTS